MITAFFDVDTQIDFLFPAGALYVPGAERIIPAVAQLNRYAAAHGFLVSSVDAHGENDPEFTRWPAHCVSGTVGQQKAQQTLLEKRFVVPNAASGVTLDGIDQVVLEKQTLDLFSNVNIGQLLGRMNADRYVVYGVVTEYCVKCAAMGLVATGRPVFLVRDAVQTLNPADEQRFFDEFTAGGGRLTTVAEVCAQ
jgi:nicotinamidase/pyrazinamidase